MQLRAPSFPLITVDPYFSVWSPSETLTGSVTRHWTGKPNTIVGTAEIDGVPYRFLGRLYPQDPSAVMRQVSVECTALSTAYVFEAAGVRLRAVFTTPLLMDDLDIMTRPVSYLEVSSSSADGGAHQVKVSISVSEELCLNYRGQEEVTTELLEHGGIASAKIGSVSQPVLEKNGDDIRIDWGYFYLSVPAERGTVSVEKTEVPFLDKMPHGESTEMTFVRAEASLAAAGEDSVLFTFAYDDVASILYFGDKLTSYWNRSGKTILSAVSEAHQDYPATLKRCEAFSDRLFLDAVRAGGEKYAELLELAYRQSIAAHKTAVDTDGKIVFISKECFSNGCAATVDVSYPSIPLFLLYNPELVRGMMRPILKYARSDAWHFDFAPHDAGRYPHVTGQVYGGNAEDKQMPVEECGNMLVMASAVTIADHDLDFVRENLDLFEAWVKYLEKHGSDPENQLCTDDFAGHLAHNCNLSLKAIMGIAGLGILYGMLGQTDRKEEYTARARDMARRWVQNASNGDGSFRLAFDRAGTWSMKYNIVWDKLWGTEIMDRAAIASEFASYKKHINPYGMPLDNRETYTKSDWLVWTATLASERADFEAFVAPLWEAYHHSPSRVPMTDWYFTVTSAMRGFQHRSVQGGLFIKLLEYKGVMRLK
ncbi:MAG: glutaminase domain-containing protein [Eubacteriales bacterium]